MSRELGESEPLDRIDVNKKQFRFLEVLHDIDQMYVQGAKFYEHHEGELTAQQNVVRLYTAERVLSKSLIAIRDKVLPHAAEAVINSLCKNNYIKRIMSTQQHHQQLTQDIEEIRKMQAENAALWWGNKEKIHTEIEKLNKLKADGAILLS